jgi:response regulator RpfG family c-di-GMP phosphodiesterase
MLDDTNKILLTKERIIEELNVKVIEFESKVKEDEITIKELKSRNIYDSHLSEMESLKIKM